MSKYSFSLLLINEKFVSLMGDELAMQQLTFRFPQITQTLLEDILKCLVGIVKSETAAVPAVAMQAIGHIGLRIPLPPLCSNSESGNLCYLS